MVSGSRARASSIRSVLIRLPIRSSIHIRAPPAPQQNPRFLHRSISSACDARDGFQDRPRRGEDLVVPAQETRVVVGQLLLDPFDRGDLALVDQPGQQLGVVDHLVVAAELRVLPGDGVEAVRAGRHDRLRGAASLRVSMFCWASMENTNSLPDPPGRVPGAASRPGRAPRSSPRPGAAGWRWPWWSSWPGPPAPRRSRPRTGTPSSGSSFPSTTGTSKSSSPIQSPRGLRPCPTGRPCSPGSAASRPPRPGTRTRSASGAAHPVDVVDVLDIDRALLDARPAVRARPQHVRVDHPVLVRPCRPAAVPPRP